MGLVVDGGRLIVEPRPRPRYTLDELLAQCDPSAELAQEEREWLDTEPVGREPLKLSVARFTSSRSIRPTAMSKGAARAVLVVSPGAFNRLTKVPIVLLITRGGGFARTTGFAVSPTGTGTRTTGVIRCNQPRALDLGARRLESVPEAIIDEVLAKLAPFFG